MREISFTATQPLFWQFFNQSYPHCHKISCGIPTDYLCRRAYDQDQFCLPDNLLVRDNHHSLKSFFRKFPEPGTNVNGKLIISSLAAAIVPTPWAQSVHYFAYSSKARKESVKRIVLVVAENGSDIVEAAIRLELKKALALYSKAEEFLVVTFGPPQLDGKFGSDLNCQLETWQNYSWSPHFRFDFVIPIGFSRWTLDSWCLHLLLSRQAQIKGLSEACAHDYEIKVSLNHSYVISKNPLPLSWELFDQSPQIDYENFYKTWIGSN